VLRTERREVLVAGDAAYTERGLRGEAQPLLVHDEHFDRRSLKEIRRCLEQTPAAIAIPGHDPELWRSLDPVYE
jgi:N-acyl homoserine lactone hydrolase